MLKHLALCSLAAGATFLAKAQAEERDPSNYYWRLSAGPVLIDDFDERFSGQLPSSEPITCDAIGCNPNQRIVSLDTGYSISGAIGRQLGSAFRGEVEYQFSQAGQSSIRFFESGVEAFGFPEAATPGEMRVNSAATNLYYDFDVSENFVPFVGLGVGLANVDDSEGASDEGLLFKGRVGLSAALGDGLSVDIEYVGQSIQDLQLAPVDNSDGGDLVSSEVLVSIRRRF